MRATAFLPFLILAACSEGAEQPKQAEAPAVEAISAGQWEMVTEVTRVTKLDKGAPVLKMPEGSKTTTGNCVAEADVKKPPASLFAPEGFQCDYRDSYMRNGRFNATLGCTKAGLGGDVSTLVNGSYTADTIEATATIETRLYCEGDARIETKLTGRRTGECSAAPTKG